MAVCEERNRLREIITAKDIYDYIMGLLEYAITISGEIRDGDSEGMEILKEDVLDDIFEMFEVVYGTNDLDFILEDESLSKLFLHTFNNEVLDFAECYEYSKICIVIESSQREIDMSNVIYCLKNNYLLEIFYWEEDDYLKAL